MVGTDEVPLICVDDSRAERLLRDLRDAQDEERLRACSAWQQSRHVFTTEFGEPCDPRNALRALKVAAARAGSPTWACTRSGATPFIAIVR